jgi:hypothetical protein
MGNILLPSSFCSHVMVVGFSGVHVCSTAPFRSLHKDHIASHSVTQRHTASHIVSVTHKKQKAFLHAQCIDGNAVQQRCLILRDSLCCCMAWISTSKASNAPLVLPAIQERVLATRNHL